MSPNGFGGIKATKKYPAIAVRVRLCKLSHWETAGVVRGSIPRLSDFTHIKYLYLARQSVNGNTLHGFKILHVWP